MLKSGDAGTGVQTFNGRSGTVTLNSADIDTALGYIPPNPNGTNLEYIAGDGSKVTFPTIPAQFNPSQGIDILITGSYPSMTFNADTTIGLTKLATQAFVLNHSGGGGISSLNGLTGTTQTFAIGTSGTNFNISSSGTIHTFNIPITSGSNTGLVTPTLFNLWNAKWGLSGNSGTISGTNFIGTTDGVPLSFRIGNSIAGKLQFTGGTSFGYLAGQTDPYSTAFGYSALASGVSNSDFNTAVGYMALTANTTGTLNTALGHEALLRNTTGFNNVGIGPFTLSNNTTGRFNTTIGYDALQANVVGNYNTTIGFQSGFELSGSGNIILGSDSSGLMPLTTGSYNTIIGGNITGIAATLWKNIILADGQGNQRITVDSFGTAVVHSKTALGLPAGTTAQRPSSAVAGYTRWNTDSTAKETFNGSIWVKDGSGGGGGGSGTVTSVGAVIGTSGTDFNIGGTSPITTAGTFTFNLPIASSTNTGKLSNTDWSTFNGKQPAGSYITALTGDVAASGPGSAVATIQANAVTTTKINNNAVTYAKMQAMTANKLLGSGASGTAVAEITLGTGLSFSGTTLNATGGGGSVDSVILRNDSLLTNTQSVPVAIPFVTSFRNIKVSPQGSVVMNAFGDSYTQGNGIPTGHIYCDLLSQRYGLSLNNFGLSGSGVYYSASEANLQINPAANNTLITLMAGFNNLRVGSDSITYKMIANAYSSVICQNLINTIYFADNAAITYYGSTWATFHAATFGGKAEGSFGGEGMTSNAVSDSLTFPFTGDAVIIGYVNSAITGTVGAKFDVYIDEVYNQTIIPNAASNIADGTNSNTTCAGATLIKGLGSASHTLKIINDTSLHIYIDYLATVKSPESTSPVIVALIPKMDSTGFANIGGSIAIFNRGDSTILATAANFSEWPVTVAYPMDYTTTANLQSDHIHQNTLGTSLIANAFAARIFPAGSGAGGINYTANRGLNKNGTVFKMGGSIDSTVSITNQFNGFQYMNLGTFSFYGDANPASGNPSNHAAGVTFNPAGNSGVGTITISNYNGQQLFGNGTQWQTQQDLFAQTYGGSTGSATGYMEFFGNELLVSADRTADERTFFLQANAVSIGNGGAVAHPSAVLDIGSTTKGIRIPRLTETQMLAVSTPTIGDFLYNSDSTRLFGYDGTAWRGYLKTGEGGAGGTLSNLGSAYRAAVAGTSNVKTFSASRYLKWDSATTGQLNVSLDTTTLFAALADTVTIRNLGSGQVQAYGLSKVLGIATINGLNSISATTGTDSAINVKLVNDTAIGTAASYYYGTSTGGSAGRRGFYPLPSSGVTTVAFGSTPNSNGASISGTTLTIQPANGSNPGGVSTAAQVFGGSKEISGQLLADGGTNNGTSHITIQGNLTGSAQGPGGNGLFVNSYTYTDNSSSTGSVATSQPANAIFQTTLAASNTGVVYTGDVATLKIAGAPIAGTNVTINNPYALYVSAGNSFFGGNVSMRHLIGNSSTPGIAAGTGAGSSPTIGITGSDLSGTITLTSGTLPTLSATVATVTYNAAYGSQPRVVLTPVNSNAALLSGVTMVYINDASSSASSFVLTAGTTALSAATIYVWYYQVVQ